MVRNSDASETALPIERRPLMKLAGAAAGASFVGGSLVETASASTGDHDGVQVDFVTGFAPNENLGSTTYSSEGRLINWAWGERYANTGEDMDKEPKSDTLDVTTTNGVEFDFSANTATVNYTLSGSGGDQDLLLVAYDSPISDRNNPGWDPGTASDQSIYDYAYVSTQSDGSLTVDIPAADVPTTVTNHWRVADGAGSTTLTDAVGSLDASGSLSDWEWSQLGGLDRGNLASASDTAGGWDLGSSSTTALNHFLQGNGTIGAWVYLDSGELSSRRTILSSGRATTNSVFLGTAANGSDLNLTINAGGSTVVDLNFGSSAFTAGEWHPVAITCDGSTARAYVDGGEVASASLSNTAANDLASSVQVGTDPGASNTSWVGRLDDVWISDTAASARAVNAWADSTEVNYPPATGSVEAHYTLDGSTATNEVTGADATVTGSPTTGVAGIRGSAFEFTKDDDRSSTADALTSGTNLPLNGASATVAAWFRYTSKERYARVYQVGGGVSTAGASDAYEVIFNGGNDELFAVPESGNDTENVSVSPDTWYFVVTVIQNDDTVRLHVFDREGEVANSPATGTNTNGNATDQPLVMMNGDDSEPAGKLDEVYAYSTALSPEDVTDLYAASEPAVFSSIPQDDLEAYYPLDGTSATNLITGTDATEVGSGSPTKGVDGIRGNAYQFSKDDDRSSTQDTLLSGSTLPLNGSEATVASWFRYTAKEDYARVFQVGQDETTTPDPGFSLEFDSGTTNATLVTFNGSSKKTGPISLESDTWYFFVGVVDGSQSRLHVFEQDGEVPASPTTGTDSRNQSGDETLIMMGGDHSEATGKFDEAVAYSRALSPDEVQDLFDAYGLTIGDPRVPTPYGFNSATTSEDPRVTIDGLEFAHGSGSFAGGSASATASTTDSIDTSNVSNSAGSLYSTQDLAPTYGANVLNGTYDVTIHTAELNYTSSGQRVFDVSVNGTQEVSDLDIYDEVGHDAAYTTTATGVDVKDGTLTLSTSASSSASATTPFREAYFSLDGSTATNSETSTDATLVGDPQSGATGQYGSAFEFDGDDALKSGTDLAVNGETATVAAWIRYSAHDGYARVYQANAGESGRGAASGAWEVLFVGTSQDVAVVPSGGSGTPGPSNRVTLSADGTWYFIATVFEGDSYTLYVFDANGQVGNSPVSQSFTDIRNGSDTGVLTLMAGDDSYTTGRLDEVRAYAQALTESEVTAVYNDNDVPPPAPISGIEVRPS